MIVASPACSTLRASSLTAFSERKKLPSSYEGKKKQIILLRKKLQRWQMARKTIFRSIDPNAKLKALGLRKQ